MLKPSLDTKYSSFKQFLEMNTSKRTNLIYASNTQPT